MFRTRTAAAARRAVNQHRTPLVQGCMRTLSFDLRDAFRSLRRDRVYAATVILTLAVTIGAMTAVFSIVDGVLLKPLAYRESHRLVALREIWRELADRMPSLDLNERHLEYWRAHAQSFDALAQYFVIPANLTGAGDAAQVTIARASGSLFDVLQTPAAIGRTLTPDDDREGAPLVAIVTDAVWRQRFGAAPDVVGRTIAIDGRPHTIAGVLPPDFRLPRGTQLSAAIDVFVPLHPGLGWVGEHNDEAIGRLRAGVSADQARAELDVLQAQVSAIATDQAHEPVTLASVVTPLTESVVGKARRGLLLLLAAIAAVLAIACSNLANLSLTRALARQREHAIRSALGAGRWRLTGRTVIEQLALAAIGGTLGVWIASLSLALFVRTAPIDLPRASDVTIDARVLAFAVAVTGLAGLLVAILPAWRVASHDVEAALRAGGGGVASDRGGLRARSALLALQVGLSVTLLAVTALLATSFWRLVNAARGFDAERVLAVDLSLPAARYAADPVRLAVYDRMIAAVRALPGVEAASTTSLLPMTGSGQVNPLVPDGSTAPVSSQPSANFRYVAPEFFRVLGLTLRRGRSFTDAERDPTRPTPAVVSEPAAARLWPGQDPIGRRFTRGVPGEQAFEVVGVASDARITALDRTPPLMVYVPYWWRSRASTALLIKSAADPALVPAVRRVVRGIDPEIAIGQSRPLERLVDASVAGRRYQMRLFVIFGGVALFIATVGVYAVTAYGVSRRRREMNIRAALGARRSQVLALIVRQSGTPIAAGVAAGLAGALALGGLVANLLFGVAPRDPWVLAGVTVVVAAAGSLSAVVAARRGLSLEPAAALRDE
jgi:putative ABC transport system permease protein